MRRIIIIFLLLISFIRFSLFAQVVLSGYTFDNLENKKLSGVKIQLEGTLLGAVSNQDGFFKISKIPKGKYNVIVTLSGYEILKENILLQTDTIINFSLKLKEVSKPEVVVTAARRLQSYQDVPLSITTIERDFFKGKNYFEIKDYVNFVSGLNVNSDNISIRGSSGFQFGSGSRVALLLDGFPFLSGDIGEANINIFPPEIVSRIEIVKGSGSALYGSSAMGGVVNLVTIEPEKNLSTNIQISSGIYTSPKYDEWKYTDKIRTKNNVAVTINSNGSLGKLLLSGQYLNDESYRKFNRSNRLNLFGKYIIPINNGKRISLFGFANYIHSDDGTFWGGAFKATVPPENYNLLRRINRNRFALGLDFLSPIGVNSFYQVKTSLYRTNFESNLPKNDINYRQSTSYSNFNEFQITHHLFENSIVTSGVTVINNWVNSFQYGNRKQNIVSAFTQGEFTAFNLIKVTGGIRTDYDVSDSSDNFFEISPRLGLTYESEKKIILRTSLGKGFRVATISERFASIRYSGFTIEPNPELSPEKSWNFEMGTSFERKLLGHTIFFDASVFYARYENLIEPQFDTNAATPTIRFRNIAKSEIKGIDLSLRLRPFHLFETVLSLTYLDPIDLNTKDILKFRPHLYTIASLNFTFKDLAISLLYKYVSKIVKVEEQLRFILTDYSVRVPTHLVDLNLSYNLSSTGLPIEATFTIQNLLDYYYVDLVGNLGPTRLITLGLKYNFEK
jgi:iron complex outermembrane receptor protein